MNKGALWRRIQIAFEVRVNHPVVSCFQQGIDASQGVLAAPIRSEPVALGREIPLEDRLQHGAERRLHHPVAHRRDVRFIMHPHQ